MYTTKKSVSVSRVTVRYLKEAANRLEIPFSEELEDEEKAFLLFQTMWQLQQEDKEIVAQRKVEEEITKLLQQEAEVARKLSAATGEEVEVPEGAEASALTAAKRHASQIREKIKGMKKKLPKRAPTEWSAFKWHHSGEGLCPAEMSELYRAEEPEERKSILEKYKEHLAARDREE